MSRQTETEWRLSDRKREVLASMSSNPTGQQYCPPRGPIERQPSSRIARDRPAEPRAAASQPSTFVKLVRAVIDTLDQFEIRVIERTNLDVFRLLERERRLLEWPASVV